jgi:hypothetical protein
MHRDRAGGVEDHRAGNLSPRQGSALPHRRLGDVGSSPTQGTAGRRSGGAVAHHHGEGPPGTVVGAGAQAIGLEADLNKLLGGQRGGRGVDRADMTADGREDRIVYRRHRHLTDRGQVGQRPVEEESLSAASWSWSQKVTR